MAKQINRIRTYFFPHNIEVDAITGKGFMGKILLPNILNESNVVYTNIYILLKTYITF